MRNTPPVAFPFLASVSCFFIAPVMRRRRINGYPFVPTVLDARRWRSPRVGNEAQAEHEQRGDRVLSMEAVKLPSRLPAVACQYVALSKEGPFFGSGKEHGARSRYPE